MPFQERANGTAAAAWSTSAGGAPRRPTGTRARGIAGNGALNSARSTNCENTNPNTGVGAKGRRSPRLGGTMTTFDKPILGQTTRVGAFGRDITNIADSQASHMDKGKLFKQPLSSTQSTISSLAPRPSPREAVVARNSNGSTQSDEGESSNPQSVKEYASGIFNQLFDKELVSLPCADYMDSQTDITGKMRTILIDWLVEVHMKYRLSSETLHLTVNLIDRYLSKATVTRKRLQLIGVVAMFIAAKFEEISPPELHDWVYITDNAYTKEDVLKMECTMLTALSFQIMVPTAAHFFESLQKANGCNTVHREVAQYLLELSFLDVGMLKYSPSHTVAAALMLSNELLKRKPAWPAAMVQQSHHTEQSLRNCADHLRQLLEGDHAGAGGQLQAVNKKFSVAQRHAVAKMKF